MKITSCRMRQHGLLAGLLAALLLHAAPGIALEPVRVQLKWTHAFQFAGYYAAQSQGYYRDAGLEVELVEARPDTDVVAEVVSGRAQFGIGTSSLLLARAAGQPVVALATIFQHSPLVLLARRDNDLQSIHDLAGKPVMIERQAEELLAYLAAEDVPLDTIDIIEHQFDFRDLIEGRAQAISAYSTNEVFFLQQAELPFSIFSPRSAGIDFYGDNLFTSEAELDRHPSRVAAFLDASLRGWAYALAHPQEVIDDILARDISDPPPSRAFLTFEAEQTAKLIRADLVEIGYMNPGRWQHIAAVYADLGMLERDFPVADMLYGAPERGALPAWLRLSMGGALVLILLSFAITWQFRRINRRLRASLAESARIRHELSQSEEKFRHLTEHSSDIIWHLDSDLRFTYISLADERLRGFPREEVLGQTVWSLLKPEGIEQIQQANAQRLERESQAKSTSTQCYELEQKCKNGGWLWTEINVAPMRDDQGQISGYYGVTRDISARRAAELALRASERRYRLLFERSPAGVFLFDQDLQLLDCNQRLATILQTSRERLIGLDLSKLRDRGLIPALQAALTGEEGLFEGLYRATISEAEVWLSGRVAPLYDDAGRISGGIAVFEDVGERKRAEAVIEASRQELERANRALRASSQEAMTMAERAEAANRAKSQFLANMSHEIRTPMNAVLGMTHLTLRTELTDHQRNYLNEIQTAAQSLLLIIDDILDFSKIEANKLVLEHAPFHLRSALAQVERLLCVKAQEKGVALRLELAPDLPNQVQGDRLRLGQVLINLINNAIKFTTQGQVVLRVAPAAGPKEHEATPEQPEAITLDFEVRDTGVGMSEEQMARLFEPFAQGDSSITRRYGGTGLGLAISRELVERMGGTLWVRSELGQGSTFGFALAFERVADSATHHEPVPAEAPALDLHGRRLLVVDDNRVNRVLIEELLRPFGASIATADSGEAAVARVTAEPFDLVLMDIQMPGMDGLTATRRIRAWEERQADQSHLPIIAMTAHALRGDEAKSLAAGMDAHLTKPIDLDKLVATLARWLRAELASAGATDWPVERATGQPTGWPMTREAGHASADNSAGPPPLRDCPPFEIAAALHRCNDDLALLVKLIDTFVAEFADLVPELRAHLQDGHWAQARLRAHSLKGSAATLALESLARAARELEAAIEATAESLPESSNTQPLESNLPASLASALAHLETLLPAALSAARQLLGEVRIPAAAPDPASDVAKLSQTDLDEALQHLRDKLDINAVDARLDFQNLRQSLEARISSPDIEALAAALARLDFPNASKHLGSIVDILRTDSAAVSAQAPAPTPT
ncbi:ABC transporter substrate-binding protein [Thiorhodovibrio frisius]|uniref:Sensory/regulatory protein RpfC n=1 Tax=Thiorhodovibrio frisius TaxID=631362 RepID=H8Z213_9GAMM|nr:ABC transporter substrate-binding protein [Thiorhodovibrio frisius]EIC21538.1 PAS domain S-box [Thiorhodovibrio frisius]WPL24121.1 Aerobic respiration control sensor protein ArcB [Thiorhodovibrio frisius]